MVDERRRAAGRGGRCGRCAAPCRFGFHGISIWIRRWQWFCRSMPSEAASVASRMRTGLVRGSAWNAALIRSRSSRPSRRRASADGRRRSRPAAASSVCSQFCVARYSVKMITRSSDQTAAWLQGRAAATESAALALASGRCMADSAQPLIFASSSLLLRRRRREQPGGGVDGVQRRLFIDAVVGVLLFHALDHLLQLPDRGAAQWPGRLAPTRSPRSVRSCWARVRANAAGEEKSRFLSSLSTNSAAYVGIGGLRRRSSPPRALAAAWLKWRRVAVYSCSQACAWRSSAVYVNLDGLAAAAPGSAGCHPTSAAARTSGGAP